MGGPPSLGFLMEGRREKTKVHLMGPFTNTKACNNLDQERGRRKPSIRNAENEGSYRLGRVKRSKKE